ncbi:hypothetical protein [Streptomyces sp. H27-D2]|uniref:hypothetical protein n=1 Tax=Streptomyces sp. H27-D2 TaxID=3046304 RepID=UPI002DBF6701|nr:hypothetical protein [Streptomyces sp. H27-D2]MEC4016367.1 hypothetical protein [Streptomyces sp. H27-D2]
MINRAVQMSLRLLLDLLPQLGHDLLATLLTDVSGSCLARDSEPGIRKWHN